MGTEVLIPQDPMAAVDGFRTTPSFRRRRHLQSSPNFIVDRRRYNAGHMKTPSSPPKRDRRRREAPRKTSPASSPPPLVNGRVTILRRGESLDSLPKGGLSNNSGDYNRNGLEEKSSESPKLNTSDYAPAAGDHDDRQKSKSRGYKSCDDLAICGSRRMGPESPEMLPKQIKLLPARDVYAGSAFYLSPSPRSLPLPSFFGGGNCNNKKPAMFEDKATMGLRRLLNLDR